MNVSKKNLEKARHKLIELMTWDNTPQGFYYWSVVCSNLFFALRGVSHETPEYWDEVLKNLQPYLKVK